MVGVSSVSVILIVVGGRVVGFIPGPDPKNGGKGRR